MGGVRRVARESYQTTYVPLATSTPVLTENWTTQETTTYNDLDPANAPGVWGGTKADLDRILTATGSGYTVKGALLTWVHKPNFLAGVVIKVAVSYSVGSTCAIEVWAKAGSTWTKHRRVPIAGIARSGDTLVLDLSAPLLAPANCDAYWITLAPDTGTETLTWYVLHAYGICNDDSVTPPCPPGALPAGCDAGECDADVLTFLCKDVPDDPIDPIIVLPPILVKIPNPTSYVKASGKYFHGCPRPTAIFMTFGDIPNGGSVTVTSVPTNLGTFDSVYPPTTAVTQQTISAPGAMEWHVLAGFQAANGGAAAALPPAAIFPTTDFLFTRQLDGPAVIAVANLLDILTFFWTYNFAYVEVC